LESLATEAAGIAATGRNCLVFFNNDTDEGRRVAPACENGKTLLRLIPQDAEEPVPLVRKGVTAA
jgi:hypothetical protein